MRKKYLLCPGSMYSSAKNKIIRITASDLIRLYGVQRRDCLLYDPNDILFKNELKEMTILGPRADGIYELKNEGILT